jgi:hypothetical protein
MAAIGMQMLKESLVRIDVFMFDLSYEWPGFWLSCIVLLEP